MALPGEFNESLDEIPCLDCGTMLPLKILQSAAGFYVGRFCPNCGPYERVSVGYYPSEASAQLELDMWNSMGVADPENTRDTDYNGG